MSFKDAKRKAMATSFEAMTLASDDNGVAVYAGDDYEIVSGYDQYNQYNDEKYSTVDENKNITMDSSQINITQESNSQYIPFKIPRYYDGIDLSEMTICIRYSDKLTGGTPGEYSIVNVKRNSQYICFGWLIDDKLTRSPGEYIFEIRATGQVDNLIYAWSTRPNGKINILQGIDINGAIEPSDSGWMTSFEKKVIEYTKEAKKAATEAKNAATEVNEKLNNIKESVMSEIRDEINNTSSLINYYTKTEIDTQEKSINDSISLLRNAIDNMDGLANLDISYIKANQTLTLLYKDSKKEIAHTVIDIDSLSKLQAKYTTSDGKGVLSFYQKGIEEPITSVELGSIDPSTEWIAANITPINNSIQSIQKQQAENGQKITVLTSSLDKINEADTVRDTKIKTNEDAIGKLKTSVAEIPQLKEDVSQATNTVNNMKQTVDGNKEAVDSLGTNFDNLEGRVKKLEENPASTEYDVDYADNIFYWKENGETVKTFTIQGGGVGGTTTSTMTIERVTPADAIFLLGNKAVIEYTWSSVDNVGDSTGIGTAVWKVDNTTVSTLTVGQGRNSIDLTEFLKTGTNSIRLSITDSVGTLSTKTWTITIVDFKLESSFDDTLFYSDEVSFRYIPYGNINKTVHFILDGVELDSVNTTASGRQLSYVLTKQSHGAHLLKVYMTATVNNQAIQSSTIIKDIIWVDPDERIPIIGCAMQEFTTQQYHATNIPYVVYDPDHNPATVKLAVNGNTVSTLSVNRTVQTWSYKSSDVGSHDLTISCRKVTKILKANIEKLDIDVEPVTANLEFDFNPTGYSNSDTNRLWSDKNHSNIAMTVSDNFDWSNGGYQIDKDGNQYFCVKAGTTVKINYNLFGIDPKQTGSEFKVVFKTTNVRDASATFLSCINKKDANPVGLEMNVHEANIYSSTSSLYFPYSEEDIIEYEFNINALDTKTDGATSIIMTYEDGVGGRPMIYNDVHRLYQYEPLPITIGCDDCDVHIYRMKAYSASLTDTDILANFIADARDADDMIARFERNQIYDENNSLTPESVAKACPDLRIIKIEAPHFTNDKKDFVKNTSMQCIYTNGDPVLDNWKFTNCYHAGQGTTSNEYGFAARNIDVICCFDGEHQVNSKITLDPDYKTILELGDGSKTTDGTGKISLTRNSIPNNWWNFKVNVASSNMATNALGQKRFNDFLPYTSPATKRDPKVKNSMEFVNCVIFLKESDPDISTHREFQDTDWHFYSLGNMGDSKKTDVTRAYDPDDMKEFCIEISDNTLPNSAFQTGITNPDGTMKYPISKEEWKTGNTAYDNLYNNWDGSFEFRYDCCGDSKDGTAISSDEAKEQIRTNNRQIWRDFYEFVITSSDEDFVAHLGDWMIEEAALYFYLVTLRYSMIDNRAKNVFPHWAKHYMSTTEASEAGDKAQYYIIDDAAAAIHNGYRFDLWAYDMDTQLGINNSGELVFPYGKEDTDYKTDGTPSSGYVFNAAESTLWCRIRDLMPKQLSTLYQSVDANCWSDTHLINEYKAWQNQFPEELWRLHYDRLYFRTYRAGTVRFLQEMMNGRGIYHLAQWERDQHAYMGTKFVHTDVKSDQIMFRCNTPKEAVVKPDYTLRIVPYSDMYISVLYGNSANPTQVRAKAGQEYEITTNLTNMDDTAVLIYCASRIQALNNLSACYIHDNDFSKASKLKTLIIGNDTEGYQNSFLTNLNMGNNVLLEELDVQNCPNLTGSINLSACENLLKLNASGTIISSVSFATHGKITHAYLPATINTLTFKDLQNLTDLVIPSYENLETFICRNSKIDALSIIKKAIKSLKTVTVTGINWNLDNTDILKVLAKLSGKDENEFNTDHSVLTGTIHIPVIRDQELKEYIGTDEQKGIWSNLEISYDSLIVQYKITCVNADEAHTVLDIQYVDKGADGEDPLTRSLNPIKTPTIPSTVENDFVFKRWDSAFTKIFADRVITAVYDPVIRNYTVEYILKPTLNASETVLQSSTGPFGSTIEYEGETPRYTAEESAFKYYLFKEWDKSGLVTGNKKIYTVFDSCEYTTGYFDGKDLGNLSEVELYTMMKMSLEKEKTKEADTLNFKLGVDYNYDDVESKEFISETTEFDGTNYIDTNTTIMDIDRDFTFAIDFEFDAGNTSGATLAQCFQSNGSNGFRLWYSSNVNLNWGTKSTNPAGIADRELVVIRHKAGSEQAYIYCSNLTGNEVSTTTLSAIRIPVIPSTLVFGCSKADDGEYEKYAKGKIHWAKLWYADLGDGECKDIAAWVHETIPMMVAKYKEYYLSDNTTKRANITFIGKNLLSANCAYGNISGGWAKSSLNSWLNTRLPKAIPPLWKSLIKKVNVIANNADKAKTTSTSECYFYIPSVYEIDPTISGEPYSIETDSTISFMTSDFVRRRAKVSTPNIYEAYPTRSADVDQSPGTWLYGVDGGDDTPGRINGYYYPQTAGVLIMFSISCEG